MIRCGIFLFKLLTYTLRDFSAVDLARHTSTWEVHQQPWLLGETSCPVWTAIRCQFPVLISTEIQPRRSSVVSSDSLLDLPGPWDASSDPPIWTHPRTWWLHSRWLLFRALSRQLPVIEMEYRQFWGPTDAHAQDTVRPPAMGKTKGALHRCPVHSERSMTCLQAQPSRFEPIACVPAFCSRSTLRYCRVLLKAFESLIFTTPTTPWM